MERIKAIYLRKSRESDNEKDSLETHRTVLMRICDQNNWKYDIFEEIASGSDTDRPQMKLLLDNIDQYDGIVCMDADRLSRHRVESAEIQELLLENDVKIITPSGTIDLSDLDSDFMHSLKTVFATAEHRKIKARMKAGKINRFKNGEFCVGKAPFGYKIENKRLVIDPDTAPHVKIMFEMSASGMGHQMIENETGIYPKHILANKCYIGEIHCSFVNSHNSIEELVQLCPPIVDIELFVRVQEEIKRRRTTPIFTRGTVKSCIQGLLKCKRCGNQLSLTGRRTFVCPNRKCDQQGTVGWKLEKMVLDDVSNMLDGIDSILYERSHATVKHSTVQDDISTAQNELAALQSKLGRTKELYMDGDISKADYASRKALLEQELSHIELKLKSLQIKKARDEDSDTVLLEELAHDLNELLYSSPKLPPSMENMILRKVIDNIIYDKAIPSHLADMSTKLNGSSDQQEWAKIYRPIVEINYRHFK